MNIAIDVSPLTGRRSLSHRVRGTGFYIENLKKSLLRYYPQNDYQFFSKESELSSRPDLIHYPYFEPFFLTLPKRKNIPVVVTVHDLIPLVFPKDFPLGIKGKVKWYIQKRKLATCDAIITDSQASKNDVMKFTGIPSEKIRVVYLAPGEEFKHLDLSGKQKSIIRKKYNLPEKFALYVGDATWNKNLPRLVEAIEESKVPLVMTGKVLAQESVDSSNPWNRDLVTVIKIAKQSKKIIRVGFVPTEDLINLYNLASVFVMPSLYEGFGLPILEAMICGCPVITSREGSLGEGAGEGAYYVDAYNTKSIRQGIDEVVSKKNLQEDLRKKGFTQVKNFSWEKTAGETIKVYEKVVSKK